MGDGDDDSGHTDLYALLHVSRKASDEEIKKAYRKLAQAYHPDKYHNSQMKETAKVNFQRICEAHEVLSDENKRKIYDLYGMEGVTTCLQLGPRMDRVDEVVEELEKMRLRWQEEQAAPGRVRSSGALVTNLSLPDFAKGEGIMRGMSMSSESESYFSRNNMVRVAGNMAYAGDSSVAAASAVLTHDVSSYSSIQFMASAGLRSLVIGAQTSRYLSAHSSATTGLAVSLTDGSVNLSNSWTHRLSETCEGNVKLILASESSISVGWAKEEKRRSAAGQLKFGPSSFAASGHYTHPLTSSSHLHMAGLVGNASMEFEFGAGRKVSRFTTLQVLYSVGFQGVFWKVELIRGTHKFIIPVLIFRHLSLPFTAGALIIPASLYFLLEKFIINPYLSGREKQKMLEGKAATSAKVEKARTAAGKAQQLMENGAEKKRRKQEEGDGLVITRAVYGKKPLDLQYTQVESIDVTLPLNFFVTDSGELMLHGGIRKAGLMGFCDPCPGVPKQLAVEYRWRGRSHLVYVDDREELIIP